MGTLQPGNSDTFVVKAKQKNNHSGINLIKAGKYSIKVDPPNQTWTDGKMPWKKIVDANGFSHWFLDLFSITKRYRGATWFKLMGRIANQRQSDFPIGVEYSEYRPSGDGELICYANDASFKYGNNSGELTVRISRES